MYHKSLPHQIKEMINEEINSSLSSIFDVDDLVGADNTEIFSPNEYNPAFSSSGATESSVSASSIKEQVESTDIYAPYREIIPVFFTSSHMVSVVSTIAYIDGKALITSVNNNETKNQLYVETSINKERIITVMVFSANGSALNGAAEIHLAMI